MSKDKRNISLKISEESYERLKRLQQHFSSTGTDVVTKQWTTEKCIELAYQMFINKGK